LTNYTDNKINQQGRIEGCWGLRLPGSMADFYLAQSVSLWPTGCRWPGTGRLTGGQPHSS